ncbi:MAG: DUF4432 family protein [Anaerolineales bacterium]|nr:DUF4432 family protein [Anaerolineales bacterium]
MSPACQIRELTLPPGNRAVVLENDLLAATILPEQGADIYALVYKPRGVDVLWKSGRLQAGRRAVPPGEPSLSAWLNTYSGGWQVLFPNGGAANAHQGLTHSFHGEAAVSAWDYTVPSAGPRAAEVRLSVTLAHSPFRLERTLRLEAGRPVLQLHEQVSNTSAAVQAYICGQHPAFGAPLIGPACRIDTGASFLLADPAASGPASPLTAGSRYPWPVPAAAGRAAAVNTLPDQATPRRLMAYFTDFEATAWYALTNTALGFGVGLAWPRVVYPYAWFWQELRATPDFPWNGQAYVMAIEPATCFPAHGLAAVARQTGTVRSLAPGAAISVDLCAAFYDGSRGVARLAPDGTVQLK